MAKSTAKKDAATPEKSGTGVVISINRDKLVASSRGKEVEFWEEPIQVGEAGSLLKVTCTVDAVKCTFKVTSAFTTKQFHIYSEAEQIAMLQKKAVMELEAGKWGVKRCQYWNEQHGGDPSQLGMNFPNQGDGDGDED